MGSTKTVMTLAYRPDVALQHCVRALTERRFGNITMREGLVTAQKRKLGQWTAGTITLEVSPHGDGSRIAITATASAQSLFGLAFSPSRRMVEEMAVALAEVGPDRAEPGPGSRLVDRISAGGRYGAAAVVCVILAVNFFIAGAGVLATLAVVCAVGCSSRWYAVGRRY